MGDWKLVKAPMNEEETLVRGGKGSTGGAHLYHLKQDIGEQPSRLEGDHETPAGAATPGEEGAAGVEAVGAP